MPVLNVHGRPDPAPAAPELARGLPAGAVRPKHSLVVDLSRAAEAPVKLENVADDDVVELETQDGLRVWLRVDQLERDFGLKPERAAGGALTVPTTLRVDGRPTRGVGEWAIKALKVFGVDVPGKIVDFVKARVENRLEPGPGLFRCLPSASPSLEKPRKLTAGPPVLVFLHGTASSTAGSFGELWGDGAGAPIQRAFSMYKERVLAYQHRTLSQSPLTNAVELVRELVKVAGKGARLHLVSHSRGGLIGELLARGNRVGAAPFDALDRKLFAGRQPDLDALAELDRLLADAGFLVERFIRVACPARGTTLADRRLDRYFSVITNLAGLIPVLKGSVIYDGLTGLVAGVLKKRTEPEELPGLEAMMPGSPLVRMLNRADVQSKADLHVLGGDLEAAGAIGRLKALATDFFYLEDHDLVVNTRSMFGGVDRANKIRYWIDTGGGVTHFDYFRNADTATRLVGALEDPAKADFHDYERKTTDEARYQKRAAVAMPVLFVLPGIMGSNLSLSDGLVWMDYLRLGAGGLADLGPGGKKVTATSLVGGSYSRLVEYLSHTHDVVPFPYDWRMSVESAAEDLRAALAKAVKRAEAQGQPVRILAHSMGGLVVRAMLATTEGRALWEQMGQQSGSRFVMLGTPNGGSHAIAALLMGRDALAKKLALLDITHSHGELLQIIAGFDGVLNLLPHDGDLDLYDEGAWKRIFERDTAERGLFAGSAASTKSAGFAWTVPARKQLLGAAAVRDLLRKSPIDSDRMAYVAGVAPATPCAIRIDDQASAGRRVAVLATTRGDGRVPWATGIPKSLADAGRVYYMDVVHGDMADATAHFEAIGELLSVGATAKLPQVPPGGRDGAEEVFPLRTPEADMLPDIDDLRAAALGGTHRVRTEPPTKVHVRVVHSNLVRAQSPVLVGHYKDDVLVSAEKRLDERLGGRLSDLHIMDLYPGDPGTAIVVLNEPGRGNHPGAVVVGLGMVGRLTPGSLLTTVTQGLTEYGAQRVGIERRRRQHGSNAGASPVVPAPVSAILIGSAEGGVSITDSLRTILRAVVQANGRLRRPADEAKAAAPRREGVLTAFIDRVDVIELYEDRAIQAAKALVRLEESAWVRDAFVVQQHLERGSGGEWRASYEEPPGWLQRIRVAVTPDGESLEFEATTQKGRAPAVLGKGNLAAVRTFLGNALLRPKASAHDVALGHLLFDMLVPPDFKEYAPERQRLALQLDPEAAALPWELLHDRHDRGARPLSVETGMVRQLLDDRRPERRRESLKNTALVIGNPPTDKTRFVDLPGAATEARDVVTRVRAGGYEVTSLIGREAEPRTVISTLHLKPWRILHIAAHGVFEEPVGNGKTVTGIVLDDGIVLTPEQLTQMTYVPELVFINCCHLGTMVGDTRSRRDHQLAANVATHFIRVGARAVVAAGWVVNDAAARDFAVRFYSEMLGGAQFGEAIRLAREETYDSYRNTNTWGAYQCYGDAGFMLRRGDAPGDRRPPVDPQELTDRARSIAQQATVADAKENERLRQQLRDMIESCRREWRSDPGLCAAVGAAYAELGDFEQALEYHRRFMGAERADGSVRALEQLVNVTGRRAVEGKKPAIGRDFVRAERVLDSLLALAETSERRSLKGGLHKRRAVVAGTKGARGRAVRRRALEQSLKEYSTAVRLARERAGVDVWFPLVNEVASRIVLSWRRAGKLPPKERSAIDRGLAELEREAANVSPSATDFWPLSRVAEHKLLVALSRRRLDPAAAAEILAAHEQAAQLGRSGRQLQSVIAQVRFFARLAALELPPKQQPFVTQLEKLADALSA